jgi:hypothetical protein
MTKRLRHIRHGASGEAASVLDTILRWSGNFAKHDSHDNVDPGVAAWKTFTAGAAKRMFGRFSGEGVESVLDTRGSSHMLESTWGEVYALRHLSRKALQSVATNTFASLAARFKSSNPAKWREPRTMYEPSSQGAASMPKIPFFDRGTYEQVVELGP